MAGNKNCCQRCRQENRDRVALEEDRRRAQQTKADLGQVTGNFKKWVARQLGAAGQGALWERRFDDNAITRCIELAAVVQYIHNNPVRIGIVGRSEDYFWSSARNYSGVKPVAMEIDRLTEML